MPPSSKKSTVPVKNYSFPSALLGVASATAILLPTSLILFAYERALIPLYGSGPTTFLLSKVVLTTIIAVVFQPFKIPTTWRWLVAALSLSLAPNATYWTAVLTARRKHPVLGPAVTHVIALAPLIFILATIIVDIDLRQSTNVRKSTSRPPITFRLAAASFCYALSGFLCQRVWPKIPYLNNVSESQIFLGLASVAFGLWIVTIPVAAAPLERGKRPSLASTQTKPILLIAFIAMWWSIHPVLYSPVLPHPLKETYTHPSAPLQIHSSVQSTTGLIVVGEALPLPGYNGEDDQQMHSVRYLRASHSILGGVWMGEKVHTLYDESPVLDSYGTRLGDTIYSTFVLQEAARLVNSTERGRKGLWQNALIIGLGTGISATALSRHGVSTTIIEIDPAVYDAARTFFGLPDPGPGKVFLEDARTWAAAQRASIDSGNNATLYDIVIHDCFSGGGVPKHIFTIEFWEDLKKVMQPEGIIVVNFAGVLKSDSSRMVLQTVEKSFGQCRGFHDMFSELTNEKYDAEFINMVLFCTQAKAPLTFRQSRKSDYLGSPIRRHIFKSLLAREVNLDFIRTKVQDDRLILTDAYNPLGKLQDQQGLEHWTVMREVLPDVHWETY